MEYSAILHDMDKRFCYAIEKQEGGSSGKESERKGRESPKTIQKRNEAG